MEPSIFISYARPDLKIARALAKLLQCAGFKTWFDKENLRGGQDWESVIKREIGAASLVLMCLSPKSVDRTGFFQREMKFALCSAQNIPEKKIFIMPVRLADCDIPDSIKKWHVVDIFEEYGAQLLLDSIADALDLAARAPQDDRVKFDKTLAEYLNTLTRENSPAMSLSSPSPQHYAREFQASDWLPGEDQSFFIKIPFSEHGTRDPNVHVLRRAENGWVNTLCAVGLLENDNVEVSVTSRFHCKIVIK